MRKEASRNDCVKCLQSCELLNQSCCIARRLIPVENCSAVLQVYRQAIGPHYMMPLS